MEKSTDLSKAICGIEPKKKSKIGHEDTKKLKIRKTNIAGY